MKYSVIVENINNFSLKKNHQTLAAYKKRKYRM